MPTQSLRTYVYVDGFNLYYGALKKTEHKWLDLKVLFENLLQNNHKIERIKYFTALVGGKFDPNNPIRQKIYIDALESYIPEITVKYGHFLTHPVKARLVNPINGKTSIKIYKTEEKGSDVNLAVHLLNDAWKNLFDCAVIVSNDSDLAESMKFVKIERQKSVGLIFPSKRGRPSRELQKHATFTKRIRPGILKKSQLPDIIPGTNIKKPKTW